MWNAIFNIIFVSPHEWMTSFYWILVGLHHRVIKFVWFKHRLFFLFPLYVQIQPLSYLTQWKTLLLITEHCINTNMCTHAQTHRRSHSLPFSVQREINIDNPTRQQKTRLNMSLQKCTMQSSLTFEQWISVTFLVIWKYKINMFKILCIELVLTTCIFYLWKLFISRTFYIH